MSKPQEVTPITLLRQDDALMLANELVHGLCRSRGIRVLSIKGITADLLGLRPPRVSADADILVEPARAHELIVALERSGWHSRFERVRPLILQPHARTLIHDQWPCDIDVHYHFPGFFAEAQDAFEVLWRTRTTVTLDDGSNILAPSRAASALILAVNQMRHGNQRGAQREDLITSMSQGLNEAERCEVNTLATGLRARSTGRALLDALGLAPGPPDLTPSEHQAWTQSQRTFGGGGGLAWILDWKGAAWQSRPGILARAVWVPRAEVPRNDPDRIPTHAEAWRHRIDRWTRAAFWLSREYRNAIDRRSR